MKRFFVLLAAVAVHFTVCGGTQHAVLNDSTVRNDTLQIAPYPNRANAKSLGSFAVVSKDTIAFQTYAGSNVLNTLRGHIPNLFIGSNALLSGAGLRSSSSMLLIDGLPYSSEFGDYYNLNSFDYGSAYALSAGNAVAWYGGTGANGAFVLTSKTGENLNKPTFEFNSSPSVTYYDLTDIDGNQTTEYQWRFANALAYQQDFGAVDTRISYTYSLFPSQGDNPESRSGTNSLRINTGLSLGRFKARLILDDYYTKTTVSLGGNFNGVDYRSDIKNRFTNRQGNLKLTYQLLDWLVISSQGSIGEWGEDLENYSESSFALESFSELQQHRDFVNAFLSAKKSLGSSLLLTAALGGQYEKIDSDYYRETHGNSVSAEGGTVENKTTSVVADVGLQLKDFLFFDFIYRSDKFSIYARENDTQPTYSFNSAFVFSDALGWTNSWFNLGKLRASVGKANVASRSGYPQDVQTGGSGGIPNPSLVPESKRMTELGMDLAFAHNRFLFSTTYFVNNTTDLLLNLPVLGGSGYGYVLVNSGELQTEGWELVLGGAPVRKENLSLDLKVSWATLKTTVESIGEGSDDGDGNVITLGNPNPDWRGSFLGQLRWKDFFASILVTARKGGDIYIPMFPGFEIVDGSQVKMQDISVGYRFAPPLLSKLKMRQAQVSLSGRNVWTIYSGTDMNVDPEGSVANIPQGSVCLSLSLTF